MIRSIFSRLLISHIIVILLTTVLLGALMSYLIRGHVVENKRREMLAKGQMVAAVVARAFHSGRLPDRLDVVGELIGSNIWVADRQGRVLAGDRPSRLARTFPEDSPKIEALFAGATQSWVRSGRNQTDPAIIVALPVSGTAPPAAVFLYTPITGVNLAIQAIDRLLLFSLLAGTLAAAILGFFIARGLTRPIAGISQAAARFAAGDYTSRTTATGGGEIGDLGRTFNAMADSLAKTEQNRREFLANVSHELKTPVASIQALAEALADGVAADPGQQRRYHGTIVAECRHIDRLLGDLLDLAQLEAGELAIAPGRLDLAAFLENETAKYRHLLGDKNLTLTLDAAPGLPPVLADSGRLAQIIANLLTNAIRHTEPGGVITLAVRAADGKAAVSVTDHGPGIPAADQPFIFERFYRVDKARSRGEGGSGLGLAITKRLVQAMGGDISVHSPPGEGATFTFTLPLALPTPVTHLS